MCSKTQIYIYIREREREREDGNDSLYFGYRIHYT
jgi:hypothetical protein